MHSLILSHYAIVRDKAAAFSFVAAVLAMAIISGCSSNADPTSSPSPTNTPPPTPTLVPTDTPAPTVTPSVAVTTPTPAPADLPDAIPIPPERDLYEIGRRLVLKTSDPVNRQATPTPPLLKLGDTVQWTVNRDQGNVVVTAQVSLVTENAYWIFEEPFSPDIAQLAEAAGEFESVIWPTITGALGNIWSPGVDGDPRLVIFHGRLRSGVAGYYSSVDEYPVSIQPDSNQREVIYISVDNIALASTAYKNTLAHELQHAIHWAADPGEESWVNEGISELAAKLAGYPAGSVNSFLRAPNTSLLDWEPNIFQASPNYGAASLFFEYLHDHYGGAETIRAIIENQSDGIDSIDEVLSLMGFDSTMIDVFSDWIIANFADDDEGIYSHPDRDTPLPFSRVISAPREMAAETVRPFGSNYYTISSPEDEVTIEFSGVTRGHVFPAEPRSGNTCWWTNTGDSIASSLTRNIDLSSVEEATLQYYVWTSIESEWDYLYVQISADDGETWEILPTALTSDENPNGGAFGPGITGNSLGWIQDSIDLSSFVGGEIILRFEHITDDAVHGRGACLDDFSIPEIGWADDTSDANGWTVNGFARINDEMPIEFLVQVIRDPLDGIATVQQIAIKPDGTGELTIQTAAVGERLAVVISVITPGVSGELEYTLNVR